MSEILKKLDVRSVLVLMLVSGGLTLAILDKDYRTKFADLGSVGVGGYLGQMLPRSASSSESREEEI